jgi:outer membrane protein
LVNEFAGESGIPFFPRGMRTRGAEFLYAPSSKRERAGKKEGGHMKSAMLWVAVLVGVSVFFSVPFMCSQTYAAGGLGGLTPSGEVHEEYQPQAKGTQVAVGLGIGAAPDYEGSDDYRAVPWLFARVNWESGRYLYFEGATLKANLVSSPTWRLGPVVRFIGERDNVDDKKVDNLKDVDAAVMVGGFAGFDIDRCSAFIQVVQDVSGSNDGLVATLGVGYTMPIDDRTLVALSGTINYANGEYMSTYFGIDSSDSARSGLKTFNADAGIKDVGVGVLLQYYPWDHVGFRALAKYTRLVDDAEDSPVVDDRGDENQLLGGLMVTYRF